MSARRMTLAWLPSVLLAAASPLWAATARVQVPLARVTAAVDAAALAAPKGLEASFGSGLGLESALTGLGTIPGADAPSAPEPGRTPKVAVLYARFGAGHEMAAKAVAKAYAARGIEARLIDTGSYLPPRQYRLMQRAHLFLQGRLPRVMGALYWAADVLFRLPAIKQLRRWLDARAFQGLADDLIADPPDILISTYLPSYAIEKARRSGLLRSKYGVVITDWRTHALWADSAADRFYVAGQRLVPELTRRGIPPEKIVVSGIPVDPDIVSLEPAAPGAKPMALVMMGGYGVGALPRVARSFAGSDLRLEVVAGRNEKARERLLRLAAREGLDAAVHGFVAHAKLLALMAAAAVVVTKPGGVTTAEAEALGRPMVLVGPATGQERGNAEAVVDAGAGVLTNDPAAAGRLAAELARDPERLARMSAAARGLADPRSASVIAEDLSR